MLRVRIRTGQFFKVAVYLIKNDRERGGFAAEIFCEKNEKTLLTFDGQSVHMDGLSIKQAG